MAFIAQIIAVINNLDGTFSTQVMTFDPRQGAQTAPLDNTTQVRKLSEEEIIAALRVMVGQDVPIRAVDFKAGCSQCELRVYHTAHSPS